MKAIIFTNYGSPDFLQLQEVAKPTPKDDQILIKIHATTVTAGDCEIRKSQQPDLFWLPLRLYIGVFKPRLKILGQEMAGEVEAVGKDVTRFKVGEQVFGSMEFQFGSYAQYACVSNKAMVLPKPTNMTYEEAAAVPTGGLTALSMLRKAGVGKGKKVLIYGATGSIGTFCIQIAKYYGAEITAVCNTVNFDLVKSLGASHVIDYTQEDYTQNGETYDIIFDTVGKNAFSRSKKSLTPKGVYIFGSFGSGWLLQGLWMMMTSRKQALFGATETTLDDLVQLKDLIEAGHLKTVVDRSYLLEQMAEAHRYVDTGQKIGNVVITVTHAAS